MRRIITATILLALVVAPVQTATAKSPRVVTERYGSLPPSEDAIPSWLSCGFVSPGVGTRHEVEFPVRRGERTVDIRIKDDLHPLAILAFVSQNDYTGTNPPLQPGPGEGTWMCGSRTGIKLTTRAPVRVLVFPSYTAPAIRGSVEATFHKS
jgi:hypothetical protein